MIRFRLLGSISLQDPTGKELRDLLVQPKRVALLAYLTLGSARGYLRRDSLLALFWPESDEERARGALSQALSVIRQSLGTGVVVTRGAGEVAVASGRLWCDAVAFREALTAGREEEALGLYRDHLLTGLHATTSAAFEDWLTAERERLRSDATRAAWALADRALKRADASSACAWAQRAFALGQCTESDVRDFLNALAQLEDRAAAVRTYETFARHLRLQYDVDPSPATRQLITTLAEQGHGAAGLPGAAETAADRRNMPDDIVPPGPALQSHDATRRALPLPAGAPRRWRFLTLGAVLVAAVGGVGPALWRTPRVTGYRQITSSRVLFPPAVSPFPLATDGARVYFTEFVNLYFQPTQVGASGGDGVRFDPLGRPVSLEVVGTTSDRTHVVLNEFQGLEGPFWLWPVGGGAARRLGNFVGHSVGWSRDGSQLAYMVGSRIFLANGDGGSARLLLTTNGRPYWPAFSPDGRWIRFSLFDVRGTGLSSLWEVDIEGKSPRQLLAGWNEPPDECCGSWTEDGTLYVFQATRASGTHLWALREGGFVLGKRQPLQLSSGPMQFIRPLPAPRADQLLAIGWQLRGELVQYDPLSKTFLPHPAALSAEWVSYSRDGQRMLYVTYPDAELWRSNSDGSERLRLTPALMRARRPRLSPNGRQVVFEAQVRRQRWKLYTVSVDGGVASPLTVYDRMESGPTWSPDGRSLAFATGGDASTFGPSADLRILDLATRTETQLPEGGRVRLPAWSPDGRMIAAVSADRAAIRLYERGSGRWRDLVRRPGILDVYWPATAEFLHFHTMPPVIHFFRVRIRDGRVEQLGSLGESRWVWGTAMPWMGVTADGRPQYLRDLSIHHVYALDLR